MPVEIKLRNHEPIDKALRRLKNIMEDEQVLELYKARQFFMKPSEKKRAKSIAARARAKREARNNRQN